MWRRNLQYVLCSRWHPQTDLRSLRELWHWFLHFYFQIDNAAGCQRWGCTNSTFGSDKMRATTCLGCLEYPGRMEPRRCQCLYLRGQSSITVSISKAYLCQDNMLKISISIKAYRQCRFLLSKTIAKWKYRKTLQMIASLCMCKLQKMSLRVIYKFLYFSFLKVQKKSLGNF
jgi:hypothetical protein